MQGRRSHASPPAASAVDDILGGFSVVLVEDQAANISLLTRMLQSAGIGQVHGITDPRVAVQRCRELEPDLVVLDWHMPGVGGEEVLADLRAVVPREDFLPVIVITADESTTVRDRALAMGANDFLTRPFDLSEVTLRVRNLLRMRALHRDVQRHNADLQADLTARAEQEQRCAADRQQKRHRIEQVLVGTALQMEFQPITNLHTGEILGVESLARFRCAPTRPPNEWFKEAQDVGLGTQLELAAVQAALGSLGAFPTNDFISINVSPSTATDPALLDVLEGLPGHRIVLELTEHSPIDDYSTLLPALDALRDRGIRIAVDDTGAGYSGLRHVLMLRPDVLKLDTDLTHGIHRDPARRALATALVTFAHEIHATIVAEGIETSDELETLTRLGVPLGQGYYLGRPAPPPAPDAGPDRDQVAGG